MLAPEQQANWSIRIGGEYRWSDTDETYSGRVFAIDGERIHWIHHDRIDGREFEPQIVSADYFREWFLPEDASPLPALVEALLAARPLIVANSPEEQTQVLKQIDAALIAAGEKL